MHGLSDILLPLYKEEHMDKLPGAQFWLHMHPACAQYISLISNTALCLRLELSLDKILEYIPIKFAALRPFWLFEKFSGMLLRPLPR